MKKRVFILCGQSNAVGFARLSLLKEKVQASYPGVLIYNGGDCPAGERGKLLPVHPGQGSGQLGEPMFGPELGMAEAFTEAGLGCAIIKYGYGGTAIYRNCDLNNKPDNHDNWHGPWEGVRPVRTLADVNEQTSGRLYVELMETVRAGLSVLRDAGYEPEIRGLVWMQGETDGEIQFNNDRHCAAPLYYGNLCRLFNAFRQELGTLAGADLSHLPIVFGEINAFSTCIIRKDVIVAAQKKAGELPDNYLVSTEDLPIDNAIDEWHWNGSEALTLGRRFADRLMEQIKE